MMEFLVLATVFSEKLINVMKCDEHS